MDQELVWKVQPEVSAEIAYEQFRQVYGFGSQEIDGLIAIIQHCYPRFPIENRTVEWVVLKQKDMEAQRTLAEIKYPEIERDSHKPTQSLDTLFQHGT